VQSLPASPSRSRLRHPPSAAEAYGGGTRYSFSARGRQSKAGKAGMLGIPCWIFIDILTA